MSDADLRHGLYTTYKNARCRCYLCTAANREYTRKYRAAGRDPYPAVISRARDSAVKWVRANHPDVWAAFYEQARRDCGLPARTDRVPLSVAPASGPGGDRPTPTGQVTPNHKGVRP